MNFKHLQKAKVSTIVLGLIGLSLFSVAPAKAHEPIVDQEGAWEAVSNPQPSFDSQGEPFITVARQFEEKNAPISMTLTGWQLQLFIGVVVFLISLSTITLINEIKKGRPQKSKETVKIPYLQAIEAGNKYETWLNLGSALANQDQHEEAIECFDQAIRHQPFAADAWKCFGDSLFALRRFEEALDAYNAQIQAIGYQSKRVKPMVEVSPK